MKECNDNYTSARILSKKMYIHVYFMSNMQTNHGSWTLSQMENRQNQVQVNSYLPSFFFVDNRDQSKYWPLFGHFPLKSLGFLQMLVEENVDEGKIL